MIECAMAYQSRELDSDSASLGSNPSPPATENSVISAFHESRQIGPDGTLGARRPHGTRHSLKQLIRLFDRMPSDWGARNYPQAYEWLLEASADNRLTITPMVVSKTVLRNADKARAHRSVKRGESIDHCWLKEIGKLWMFEQFRVTPSYEFSECGGRFDLGSRSGQMVLECGNTNAWNCVMYLRDYPGWRYFQFPYQSGARAWLEDDGTPHVFIFEVAGSPAPPPLTSVVPW